MFTLTLLYSVKIQVDLVCLQLVRYASAEDVFKYFFYVMKYGKDTG